MERMATSRILGFQLAFGLAVAAFPKSSRIAAVIEVTHALSVGSGMGANVAE
jgi:hypothetical protein